MHTSVSALRRDGDGSLTTTIIAFPTHVVLFLLCRGSALGLRGASSNMNPKRIEREIILEQWIFPYENWPCYRKSEIAPISPPFLDMYITPRKKMACQESE